MTTPDPSRLRCGGIVHVFAQLPGRCQCGEHWWHDGATSTDPPAEPPRLRLVTDDDG